MNLVNELQISAENDDVLTVLRKTKRLASKLGRQDIAGWLKAEEEGYADDQEVPEYRYIMISYAFVTNGPIRVGFGRVLSGMQDLPPTGREAPIPYQGSISSILSILTSVEDSKSELIIPIARGNKDERYLRSTIQCDPQIAQQISFVMKPNVAQVRAIPERIKDKVLDWALALEAAGIKGENMSFSTKEKETSHNVNLSIYGGVNGGIVAANSTLTNNKITYTYNDKESLAAAVRALGEDIGDVLDGHRESVRDAFDLLIRAIDTNTTPKPSEMARAVEVIHDGSPSLLKRLGTIFEGAAGNVVASLVMPVVTSLQGI